MLVIVKPETVVRWHRAGFRRYWTWKNRKRRPGRPGVALEVRELIRDMSQANPLWGAPRVHGELTKLGISIFQAAVSKYMIRHRKPPPQTWRSFLDNHVKDLVSVDFFTLLTATFRVLFIVLRHDRRRIAHFNATDRPSAEWTAQQIVDAFPWESAPRFMLRERDGVYDRYFSQRVAGIGVDEVRTSPRSPWQNPYVERLIGSIRRECLDHVIVLDERHLRRILREYVDYYQFLPDSFVAPERCPRATTGAAALDGASDSRSQGRRPPSLLRSSRCLSSLRLTRYPWHARRSVLGRASSPRSP